MTTSTATTSQDPPRLRRALGLWDLILYGIVVIQPTAPMPVYGVVSERAHGHVVTAILIAMFAMLFTAIGYGRMARAYPSAGSAFTYVGQEIHPALGYVTGWGMVMDYLLNPLICTILCAQLALNFAPGVPYVIWALFFAGLFTGLNLFGIRTSARINDLLAIGMGCVIAIFFVVAGHYVFQHPHAQSGFFWRPFYDPTNFQGKSVLGGTSLAVLTYIGFDGISTLSEEAKNPKRDILLATVLVCLITGLLAGCEVYAAQLIWPTSRPFPDVTTAFVHVAGLAGGDWLLQLVNATLLVATIGSGMGSQLGAARLLYAMGRSDAIPRSFFAALDPRRRIPRNNVLFAGGLALAGALIINFERGVELLNFGALIAFMGVNAASLVRYYIRAAERGILDLAPPICGFVICLLLWWNLNSKAKIAGTVWMLLGLAYGVWRTSGFRRNRINFDFGTSSEP
ncbi:MAG TPA: APC family permease [Terriglobales bacterium]|nr:APC family permease [Terriglobales bacterium]